MGQKNNFQGNVWEAIAQYIDDESHTQKPPVISQNYPNVFWESTPIKTVYSDTKAIKASLSVLKKNLPEHFHALIRFSQMGNLWQLNVEKGITANQLNLLLDDLSLKIAKQIGYAPSIKVYVVPGHWAQSGLPINKVKKTEKQMPTLKEADEFLQQFLSSAFNSKD